MVLVVLFREKIIKKSSVSLIFGFGKPKNRIGGESKLKKQYTT
jgi:hypothetical protein